MSSIAIEPESLSPDIEADGGGRITRLETARNVAAREVHPRFEVCLSLDSGAFLILEQG